MSLLQNLELTKDINMNEVKKWSAISCYAAKPQQPFCMISASGEKICMPENQHYVDGASAILGNFKTEQCVTGSHIEHFVQNNQSLQQCVDSSFAVKCMPTKR